MSLSSRSAGPSILSLYDGFFLGGARIAHTEMLTHLHEGTSQRHSVLSLTDRVVREGILQLAAETIPFGRLQAAGVPIVSLSREATTPLLPNDLMHIEKQLVGADIIVSLKEQPLPVLAQFGELGRPLVVSLHRSDPENSGDGVDELVRMSKKGILTKAVCCAESTKRAYTALGIPDECLVVVPNGVDLDRYHTDLQAREELRRVLRIPEKAPVILIAARFDEMKNIGLFLEAGTKFLEHQSRAHFLMAGAGMNADNHAFMELLESKVPTAWVSRFHSLGIQSDMNSLYNAADLTSLTSAFGEAAPLCLLEAMAAGCIPLTTDVGDAASMVGDPRLITTLEADDVAAKWEAALCEQDEHHTRFLADRESIGDSNVFASYREIFESLLTQR